MSAALAGLALLTGCGDDGGRATAATPQRTLATQTPVQVANGPVLAGPGPRPLAVKLADAHDPVHVGFKRPPRAGLMFDLDTGEVLWRRNATRLLPIASVTKIMTALVVVERVPDGTKLRITRQAVRATGSKVGLLPRGKRVGVSALLYGLLLPSGNDAAVALAQGTSGSVPKFVALMNEKAASMNLRCTRFSSPSGLADLGNYSCPMDLAALARAALDTPRIARIVRRRQAVLPFPIKGGRLFLTNHNPLLRTGYPGTLGIKTGFTDKAGKCIVAAARRGGHRLGVVLLHSPDIGKQATQLLNRGFAYERRR